MERERKKKELDAKKQNGPGGKIKTKIPDQINADETCIVDKLMDEIRNGFPLKKRRGSKPPSPAALSPQSRRASRERARASFRRGSLLSLLTGMLQLSWLNFRVVFHTLRSIIIELCVELDLT